MKVLTFKADRTQPTVASLALDIQNITEADLQAIREFGIEAFRNALSLALFGSTDKKANASVDRSEVAFETSDGSFVAKWENETHQILKSNGFGGYDTDSKWKLSQLSAIDPGKFFLAFFLDPLKTYQELKRDGHLQTFADSAYDDRLAGENLREAALQLIHQKEALLQVSENVIRNIVLLDESEELKLNQQLSKAQQEQSLCQSDIQKHKEAIEWLSKIGFIKEELSKLGKLNTLVQADIARFDLKRSVLERANKVDELFPQFESLVALRKELKDYQRQLGDYRRGQPFLLEKVRNATTSFHESEKNYHGALANLDEKKRVIERVRVLDNNIATLQSEIKRNKDRFVKEQTALRRLQEEVTRLKTLLSQLNMREQLLAKKMDDQSSDALLVEELATYAEQLNEAENEIRAVEAAQEEQRVLQKAIESARNALVLTQAEIATLKNEELSIASDLSIKQRMLGKMVGRDSIESLRNELQERENHLASLEALRLEIEHLAQEHEEQTKEKDLLDETKRALRVAGVTLNAALQTLRDKEEIVSARKSAHDFYQLVLSYNDAREQLVNGKPCPLCGAIHHPFASHASFDSGTEEKLKKALEEAEIALKEKNLAQEQYESLLAQQKRYEETLTELSARMEDEKNHVLSRASELGITGLREKKPIVWSSVIRQRQTALTNRRDDLRGRTEKIDEISRLIDDGKAQSENLVNNLENKRKEQENLDQSLKDNLEKLQLSTKAEKEADLSRINIIRQLDRIYTRYGLKASTLALQKQNFPTLEKRKEAWLAWSAEMAALTRELQESNALHQNAVEQLADQRKLVEEMENQAEVLTEKLKRMMKDRHDAIANHNPEEILTSCESECANARRLFEEAQGILSGRSDALNDNQNKIALLEKRCEALVVRLEESANRFNEVLKNNGFNNEAAFLSSQISQVQKEELSRQNDELNDRLTKVQDQLAQKERELNDLLAMDLTHLNRPQLEEILIQRSDDYHTLNNQLSILRERSASNLNNKHRRQREEREFKKLQENIEDWLDMNRFKTKSEARKLARKLVLSLTVEKARLLGLNLKYASKEGTVYLDRNDSGEAVPVSADTLNDWEQVQMTLALLLARSQLLVPRAMTDGPLFIKRNLFPENADAYEKLIRRLNENGIVARLI